MSAPNSPKTKSGANGKFLPKPLLFHLRHPNSKTNEPKFWQILSPKNCFAKTSSALVPPPARILGGQNTKEKCPFLFQKKFHPRQIKKARNIFLWCCRVKRGSGGTIHSISGFCWKKVRILFRRHSKERERRSALRHKARVQVECVPQQANEGEVQRPSVSEEVLKHSSAYVCPALASAGARSKLKAQSRGQLRNVGDEILNLAK